MSGELQADNTTGTTTYFLLRNSTGQIWNGSAWEAYSTANYSTYKITGTEQGSASGFFVGNMPAVVAGVYSVEAKQQSGGSPAESDRTVGVGNVEWSGSFVGVPSNIKTNQALANFTFLMTDSTNHLPADGLTVTVTRKIDSGSFGAGTLSAVTAVGGGTGLYSVDFAAADLNGKVILLKASASGADTLVERIVTQP